MGNQASEQGGEIRSDSDHTGLGVRSFDDYNPTSPPRQTRDVVTQPRAGASSDSRRGVVSVDDIRSGHEPPVGKVAAKANQAGVELLKQSQHEEAVKQFKIALQFEPNSVQILNNIGLAYAKMQDFAGAYEWYERACSQDRSDVETLFSLAWVERKRLRYPQAKELFHKVLDLQPEHGKALYLLGDILKTNHDYEGAARYFERYVKLESSNIDGQISLAQCCEHIKQYQRAVQLYETVLHLDPNRTDVNFFLGRGYFHMKQYKKCVSWFAKIPDSDRFAFEARSYQARACRELQDHASAIDCAERAARFRAHPDVLHFLGEEYSQRGDLEKATHWFSQAVEKSENRDHIASLTELGHLMLKQSRYQEAEVHFNRVVELDRQNASALKNLALAKYSLRKNQECRTCCDAAVRIDPLNAEALWLLAEIHKDTGDWDKWFLNLRYPPEIAVADVCQTIAKGYLNKRMSTDALVWLQKVQQYAPSDLRVNEALKVLMKKGDSVNPQELLDILEQKLQPRIASTSPNLSGSSASVLSGGLSKSPLPATQRNMPDSRSDPCSPSLESEELERLLRRAEKAVSRAGAGAEQWNELKAGARAVLRNRPNDALALKCMARALISTGGDAAEIKDYARRASDNNVGGTVFTLGYELHLYLANLHEREREFDLAEKHFTQALLSKAGDENAQVGLARILVQRSETAKARQILEQVSSTYPNCVESHARLGQLALQSGDYKGAYDWAFKAYKIDQSDGPALICMGQACAKLSRIDEAERWLDQGLNSSSGSSDTGAMQVLAELKRRAGRDQDAIMWYKKMLDLRPGDYDCCLNLAQLHASRGAAGASQALHYFRSALQCRPNTKETHMIYVQMTDVQCGIKAWKDAQVTLERATREFANDAELWSKLLNVYGQLQDKQGQETCQKQLAQFDNMSISKRIAYGEVLESQGQVQQARQQYEQVLRSDPGNINAQLKLAISYRQDSSSERNLEEARKIFDQVLVSRPENVEALEGAAYCHRKLSNWDTAVQLYQLCLKTRPTGQGADIPLYYLGDILYKQHRHAECQHYLNRLVDSNCTPDFMKSALYTLAKSNVSLDEYDKAEQYARRGLVLWPNHPHFLFILALVKNRLASYDESISTLQQALQHCDSSDEQRGGSDMLRLEIRDWLAMAFERKGDYRIAMEHLDVALKQDSQHVSSIITKGLVQIGLKQCDQAEVSFKKALSIEKNHALALVRLGYCKLIASDLKEASHLFQLALQQRCGTVALPQSVKGLARVYLALCAMGQQDINTALMQLSEAKKSHKNFKDVCTSSRDAIVRGECEGLVNKLRNICDLDINTAQAWQLVHLMAKELETDMRDPKAGSPAVQSGNVGATNQRPAQPAPKADLGPRIAPKPTSGYSPPNPLSAMAAATGPAVSSSAVPAPSDDHHRRSWGAPPAESQRRDSGEGQRRDWSAPTPENAAGGDRRRSWTSAAPEPVQKPPPAQSQGALRLELREQIDAKELTQEECLGTGGFGAVYRGYWKGQEVAIKKLFCEDGGNISPLQLEELEKEVGALRSLDHPSLVKFIGASLQPPNLCIVTEYMAGGSLHHLLHKAKTPLRLTQQNRIALQVSEGVTFLHGRLPPVVHRDLKSLNIVLDRQYHAKICDFGLTQSMEKTHISLKEGGNGGSPRYMAPECYDSKGKITEKVDVWAVGCLLVEIFGGPLPYDDCTNIHQIVAKVLIEKQVPYIPNHLPSGLRPIIESCFLFDVSSRTTSQDVHTRLLQLDLSRE